MKKLGIVLASAAVVAVLIAGWQIASWTVASFMFQDDVKDLASQLGVHIGLTNPLSDDDFRDVVVHKAKKYGIDIRPDQVEVQRSGYGEMTKIQLAVQYAVPIRLPWFSFDLHFKAVSNR